VLIIQQTATSSKLQPY